MEKWQLAFSGVLDKETNLGYLEQDMMTCELQKKKKKRKRKKKKKRGK
jgi:hypothetical protein